MHEFSTVMGIVENVLQLASEKGAIKVHRIDLDVGELTFLGLEQMKFSFDAVKEGTILQDAELRLNIVKAKIECPECGYIGSPPDVEEDHFTIPIIQCPKCNALRVDIIEGKDCIIKGVEMEVN